MLAHTLRLCRSPALLMVTLLAGCSAQRYVAQPVEPAAVQAHWLATRVDDEALREPLARQGVDTAQWPLPAWDEEALAAVALTRHPDLAAARAELRSVEAAATAARRQPAPGLETTIERSDGAGDSPWTVGFVLDALLTGRERRAAQAEAADALSQAALHRAARTAWQLRQRVRSSLRELGLTQLRVNAAARRLALQQAVVAAQQARLEHGAADQRDLQLSRRLEIEALRLADQARDAQARARLALAAAVSLAPETLDMMTLTLPDMGQEPPAAEPTALQRAALLNRLDLRAALATYAAADGALKVELARQWPELVIKPGYAWDRGDNLWSLGAALRLPPGGRNQAAIAQAQAQRELQRQRCLALQAEAIAALALARQTAEAAALQADRSEALQRDARRRSAQLRQSLTAGHVGRLDVLTAELAEAEAEAARVDAQAARWAALSAVEDALQRPLAGLSASAATTRPRP